MKLAILFGSSSSEHEVSIVSACSIIKNLNKEKYDITPIYLDKENNFYLWHTNINNLEIPEVGYIPEDLSYIEDAIKYLKGFDLVFLMIHGQNGEDGKISSILDFFKIPYVGNDAFASLTTMDKIVTKIILEKNHIKTSPFLYITKYNNEYVMEGENYSYQSLMKVLAKKVQYPSFIKPSNSGSSIGVKKVYNGSELKDALKEAFKIDNRILIEEGIIGQELECALLEQDKKVLASTVGEVKTADDFYSFSAKYQNTSSKTLIPANIDPKIMEEIKLTAIKIFKILNCHTYSRCDFFLTSNKEIIFNEINTIPGFTEISMYPKLLAHDGINYSDLLDILIENALTK